MPSTILLIDDEPDVLQLTTMILERSGYHVLQANNGSEGLAMLANQPVHLVVLDVIMPDMDGWEVCRHIKSQQRSREIPVLFLTTRHHPLDRVIGTEVLRANAYLTKPFERQDLLATIQHLLSPQLA